MRFITVCNTIAYTHSRGVLHLDLKPQNIMLGKYGETLVVDWGLAKDLSEPRASSEPRTLVSDQATTGPCTPPHTPDATQLGEARGTPEYMSPEQAAGRWDVLDHGTDICSLGATLYELLTGKPPFDRKENWSALQQKIQQGKLAGPRAENKLVPVALEAICLKAMALEPQQRYGSALELAGDSEHWLADEPVSCYRERWSVRAGLAGALVNLALFDLERRIFNTAKKYLEEAAPHHVSVLKANRQHPTYRRFYENNPVSLIRTNGGLGDQAGAMQAAEKLRDLGWDPPVNAYDAGPLTWRDVSRSSRRTSKRPRKIPASRRDSTGTRR